MRNLDEVLDQLRAHGLVIEGQPVIGRLVRTRVEGERRNDRGWYSLRQVPTDDGQMLIVGHYGIWHGDDAGAQKIAVKGAKFSPEQREAMKKARAADARRQRRERQDAADKAREIATTTWRKCAPTGDCDYLARKGVGAHGVRFSPSGAMVVPMTDASGTVHGLQIIRGSNRGRRLEKQYWPKGVMTRGHYHLIGSPQALVIVAEGYATAATIHEATGYPVAVAFDAGNLQAAATAIQQRYKRARVLIAADDDSLRTCSSCGVRIDTTGHPLDCPECSQPHSQINTGINCAMTAAVAVSGSHLAPHWGDAEQRLLRWREGKGGSPSDIDFNDLSAWQGLPTVRAQIDAHLRQLGWHATSPKVEAAEAGAQITPFTSLDELLPRFALVYAQGDMIFDRVEHVLMTVRDLQLACAGSKVYSAWAEHPERAIVRVDEVGFDPTDKDERITCNLWSGWPIKPKEGRCNYLRLLLSHMCRTEEEDNAEFYQWVLKWLAYPLQNPGAKMKSTIILHGPQGAGKNMFFEAYAAIYGKFGGIIDQDALEDKHNDWASRKLFMIADEVISREDRYQLKNKLKGLITGTTIRINPKHMRAYDERNCMNMVFLSNETLPSVLEHDDRRHGVLWTAPKMEKDYYDKAADELANGGVEALYHYLLSVDTSGFDEATEPPMTQDKQILIEQSMESASRFYHSLVDGDIEGIKAMPALSSDVYELYRAWCRKQGLRPSSHPRMANILHRRHGECPKMRKRYVIPGRIDPHGPHALFLFGEETPPGANELDYLGERISEFKKAMRDYVDGYQAGAA